MRPLSLSLLAVLGCAAIAACGSKSGSNDSKTPPPSPADDAGAEATQYPDVTLAAEPQRPGDPQKGYRALVNEAYVPCGVPYTAYQKMFAPPRDDEKIPGREGRNATLPYRWTAMTTKDGVEIVTSNCLLCHTGTNVDGKPLVGLGAADSDFTTDAATLKLGTTYAGTFLTDPKEKAEHAKWKERMDTVAPYSVLSTRGPNPADGFTAVLFAHHDPKTLAWSSTPLIDVPKPVDLPVDVPPWWRMKKKTSMFYTAGGRGDHARIMMTASILCTSSVEESRAIDAYFADVRAWIVSLDPPAYPFPIDRGLADRGKPIFEARCSRCHGTYGPGGSYPNRFVSIGEVGTDALLASGAAQFAKPFVDWFNGSFFGEIARFEPKDGYIAPPLDGIWVTAPFFHNGSVPTLEAVLDSTKRPQYWTRSTWDATKDFDQVAVGWKYRQFDHGKKAEPDEGTKRSLYDTTLPGYGNGGHTFGDALADDERRAVIEYLKTL
jgi:mono/diheme cytochrome c family protein